MACSGFSALCGVNPNLKKLGIHSKDFFKIFNNENYVSENYINGTRKFHENYGYMNEHYINGFPGKILVCPKNVLITLDLL